MRYRPWICPFDGLIESVPPGSRVLDVGCGGGLMLVLLAAAGRLEHGVGFDSDLSTVSLANAVSQAHQLPLVFEHVAVQDDWPEGPFNLVSVIDVMHHVPPADQRAFLDQLIQKTPPGGLLVYKDMARRPVWRAAANRVHDLALARQWINYFPIQWVEQRAIEQGLELVRSEDRAMLWYAHELRVFTRPGG